MTLLALTIDSTAGQIAVVSSESSEVLQQLRRNSIDCSVFVKYDLLYKYCEGQQPALLLLVPDSATSVLVNRVLAHSRSNELWGIPILVVGRIDTENCIMNFLASGASDVVSSTALDIELLARIKALTHQSPDHGDEREFSPFVFGVSSQQLFRNGELIETTSIEFKLALYLFSNPNVVHSREKLLEEVWGITVPIDSRRVDTQVSRLRARLSLNGKDNQWCLISIYVRGYMLTIRK